MWKDLPKTLKVKDKVGCPRYYKEHPEILEVMKTDGERVWLATEAGGMLHGNFTQEQLFLYDYKLWEEKE